MLAFLLLIMRSGEKRNPSVMGECYCLLWVGEALASLFKGD